jgi:hypothetical protein
MSQNTSVAEFIPIVEKPQLGKIQKIRACWTATIMAVWHLLHFLFPSYCAPITVHEYSQAIERVITRMPDLRKILDHPMRKLRLIYMAPNHTHRNAAQLRTSSNIMMTEIVQHAGYIPYTVSMSGHDTGLGSRCFYMPKDLNIPFKLDEVPQNAVLLFTDVDYYADMNEWLKLFKPIMMYTMAPNKVADRYGDHAYYIKNNEINYVVSGGAPYKHKIWDYSGDTLTIIDNDKNLLTYHVTQHELSEDSNRRIITILPATLTPYPFYTHMKFENGIKRRQFTFGKKNVIYNPLTDIMSIAANGSPHAVELTGMSYLAIQNRMSNKNSPPVIADVERILCADKIPEPHVKAAVLFNLIDDVDYRTNVVPTNTLPCYFQPLFPLITEDSKNPGREFSNPICEQPSLFAGRSHNSDTACIEGRVNKVRNDIDPPSIYKKYATEFVDLLVPTPHLGVPWSVDQVRKVQSAPTQVARANMVEATISTKALNKLTAFIKAEPYTATNDPRNITTCSPELTTMMSCFTYAFKEDILKKAKWYGPSKTPTQTIKRLRRIVTDGSTLSDISRLDGSMSEFLQSVYKRCQMKWLHENYKAEYLHWHRQVYVKKAVTNTGLRYNPGFGTRSGSPITTDTNTCATAYVDYCALRGLGYKPLEAWEALGLYTGDDGARNRIPMLEEQLLVVARDLGLKYETEVTDKGEPIKYCGRIFIDPLTSDDSFQDPKRTIPKLHLSSNKNVSNEQAAINKAAGYYVTDSKTPIIGDWCRQVHKIVNLKPKNLTHEEKYKCSNSWPQKDLTRIREVFCNVMDITGQELQQRVDAIANVDKLDGFPVLFDITFENKLRADVGGTLIGPTHHVNDISTVKWTNNNSKKPNPTQTSSKTPMRNGVTLAEATYARRLPFRQRKQRLTRCVAQPFMNGTRKNLGEPLKQ